MTAESDCRWLDVCPDYYGRLQVFECAVPKDGAFVGYRTRFDLGDRGARDRIGLGRPYSFTL